jgi:dolichyl-phosphate-mannose--protein O-mannosyl transferase
MNHITNLLLALCLMLSIYIYVNRDQKEENSKYLIALPIISSCLIVYVFAYLNPSVYKTETIKKQLDDFLDGP